MAIEPAAISARPAVTMMPALLIAPVNPAASANGTVKPSDIPITMSRTVSPAVKCFSVCRVCGMCDEGGTARVSGSDKRSICVELMDPSAHADGTDSMSDLAIKCSELTNQNQSPHHDKRCPRYALNPFERQIMSERASHDNADRGNRSQRQRSGNENFPRPLFFCSHRHCGNLGLVYHLSKKNYSESC